MSRVWQLHEAKNKLGQVVEEALRNGPQIITRRGVETVVVISYCEYIEMRKPHTKLSEFFRQSPLVGVALERDRSMDRSP